MSKMKLDNYYSTPETNTTLNTLISENPGLTKGGIIRALIYGINDMSFEQRKQLITNASKEIYTTEKRKRSKL